MSDGGMDKETDFFVTGAKTYLDVEAAMAEFRRQVQGHCMKVASDRLDEINKAAEMDWTRNDLKDYRGVELNRVYLGKQVQVEGFGTIYFYLTLSRADDHGTYAASVDLRRQRKGLADDLWVRLSRTSSDTAYIAGNNLVFTRPLAEDQLQQFREHLDQAIDDFVTFIRDSGGLKKYLDRTT
jgi:hypothetical protein